jgi:hypothetical protein
MKIRPIAHTVQTVDNSLEDKVVVDGLRVFLAHYTCLSLPTVPRISPRKHSAPSSLITEASGLCHCVTVQGGKGEPVSVAGALGQQI